MATINKENILMINTRLLMLSSALFLAFLGLSLTFLPEEISGYMSINSSKTNQLFLQLLGSLYFSFGLLNWMAKGSIIGGIYNKPISLGNFAHFFIGAITLLRASLNFNDLHFTWWIITSCYLIFGLAFGIVAFRHPLNAAQ